MMYEIWAWTGFIVWIILLLCATALLVYLTWSTVTNYCWKYRKEFRFAVQLLFYSKGIMRDPYTVTMPNGKTYKFEEVQK